MKNIKWRPKALKQLRKIKDYHTRETIFNAVDELKNFPNCSNIKKLKDRDEFRLRVGRWRVFFTESFEILYIEEVKIRNENTY
jgi:mRNA interferase RelE/StbE